jgi:filamentous hemagglutinin
MAVNYVKGQILSSILERDGLDISIANAKVGINTVSPAATLDVNGNILANNIFSNVTVSSVGNVIGGNILTVGNVSATGIVIGTTLSATGNIRTGNIVIPAAGNISVGNVNINNLVNPVANSDAATKFYVDSVTGNVSANAIGNLIQLGTNSQGALISNAVTLTTGTYVTDGIALLNQVLGKLVPPSPSNFPGGQTLSLSSLATYRMANITQTDNTPGANKSVAAGATVSSVLRAATYATNTISTVGPGDTGTITAVRNGANVGTVTLNTAATPSANGTYGGNLVITNNFDYHSANANIAAGFWYVFSAAISGTAAPAGWNEIYIADSAVANTNTPSWYYDNSSPGTPSFSSTTMTPPGSTTLLYSSTIPFYTNVNQFAIGTTVANASGNMYPTSNVLASGSAGGSFAAPASVNYNASNIGSNTLNSFQSASFTTTANVTTGFGSSSTGPSMSVNNSYTTGTLTLTTALGNIVLYKSGNATAIDEGNIIVTSVGTGSGNAYRIINPGTGNTPVYTGSEAAFNSQSSTLQTYDATVVGSGSQGVLKHDQTNYSTGYLPAGPNLSSGRTGTQYFTFKFVRTDVSKFDITYAGNVAGMWVALPGSVIDASSSANGWISMTTAYAGAGYPGVNSPGNGSDGCSLGGVVVPNVTTASVSKTCTFGTVSSSSTATNEIYIRIALTSGQSVTGLSLKAASN